MKWFQIQIKIPGLIQIFQINLEQKQAIQVVEVGHQVQLNSTNQLFLSQTINKQQQIIICNKRSLLHNNCLDRDKQILAQTSLMNLLSLLNNNHGSQIIYFQERVGKQLLNYQPSQILKIRTKVNQADEVQKSLKFQEINLKAL